MIAQMAALANAQEMYIIPFKTRVLDTRQGFSVQNILYANISYSKEYEVPLGYIWCYIQFLYVGYQISLGT